MNYFNYSRRQANEVYVGATPMGGAYPIRIQSMTNTVTMDTEACVEQAKRIIEAGGEYVRLTTQGVREAENLQHINASLRAQGYQTPLVADVHFNPKVAEVAALYAEKVRINPGNYVDAARTFKQLEYTDEEYAKERGFEYIPSYTNFITIKFGDKFVSKVVAQKLLERGVIVRDLTGYGQNAIRITIGRNEQNTKVFAQLDEVLEKLK